MEACVCTRVCGVCVCVCVCVLNEWMGMGMCGVGGDAETKDARSGKLRRAGCGGPPSGP